MAQRDHPAAGALARVPLFTGIDESALRPVLQAAQSVSRPAGERFFQQGDAASFFYVLSQGRVKMTQVTPEGHQVVLRLIGPGDAFGGVAAFGDPTYPATAEVIEAATALSWDGATMHRLLESDPRLAVNALRVVASRLHELQNRYRELTTERVERRVARTILRLARESGRKVDTGVQIDFPISREDLAEMTGTTIYTVSRLVSAWEERGLVESGRQRIVICNPHGLVRIAEDL